MHRLPDTFYLGLSLRRFYYMDRNLASEIHHLRIDVNADTTACIKAHIQALGTLRSRVILLTAQNQLLRC